MQLPKEDETLATPLTSTPVMANRPIKIEGNPQKRKLSTFEGFKAVWKSPVKRGRRSATSPSVGHSVGSPNKGIVPTKDASTKELLKQQTSRIQQMAKLDTLLKKNPSSLKGGSQNMFIQVSHLSTQLLTLFTNVAIIRRHLLYVFILFQLQQMGRCAVAESNTDNNNFFYHIAGKMACLANDPAEEKAGKARETIISNITGGQEILHEGKLVIFQFPY